MTSPARLGVLAVPLAAAAFLVAGCGGTDIDPSKTQDLVKEDVEQARNTKVSSVDCPSGVAVEPGKTFSCTVHLADGKTSTATLEIRDKDANMTFLNLSAAK